MKDMIRLLTHIILWGSVTLVCSFNFSSQQEIVFYSLGAVFLAAVCYMLRWKIEMLWLFIVSHLLLLVGEFVLLSTVDCAGWYKAILALLIIYSAFLRFTPSMASLEKPCKTYIVVFAIIYVLLLIYKGVEVTKGICFWTIIFIYLLKLLHENLERMDNYIVTRSLSAEIDEKRVKRLSTQLLCLYTGGIGTLICGIGILGMDVVWGTIGGWLNTFLRFLVSLIPHTEKPPEVQVEQTTQNGPGLHDVLEKLDTNQSIQVPEWIDQMFMILVFVLIIAVLIGMVVGAVIVAYRYFYSRTKKEESEQIIETLSDEEKIEYKKNKRFIERFERSPAKRIRKIYKKNMKKRGDKQMLRFPYMSPDEQVQVLHEQGYDESAVEEVRNLYEKARYGADMVSNMEADRMRTIM